MMNLMNFICKMLCKLIVAELSITLAGAAEKRRSAVLQQRLVLFIQLACMISTVLGAALIGMGQ